MNKTLLATILAVATAGSASAATIVQNGSFEDLGGQELNRGSWGLFEAIPGWTSPRDKIEVQTEGTVGLTPQDGHNYVELDANNNSTLKQMISLGRGAYELVFYYSPRVQNPQFGSTNNIDVQIGGLLDTDVGPAPSEELPFGEWTEIRTTFISKAAGDYMLTLNGRGRSDSLGGFIDNVSIAPVPVPAAGVLLLAGLGALGAAKRRKTA